MLLPGFGAHILRRPFSVYAAKGDNVEIIYQTVGEGTAYLTEVETGAVCSLISPLGHGWQPSEGKSLIVGGGVGAAPLFMFTEQLVREGREVEVVLGAQTASVMVTRGDYASLLGRDPIVATDDGSLGYRGFLHRTCARRACARRLFRSVLLRPHSAYASQSRLSPKRRACRAGFSMEKRMACGVGACLSCVVETQAGKRRSCVDGPVFEREGAGVVMAVNMQVNLGGLVMANPVTDASGTFAAGREYSQLRERCRNWRGYHQGRFAQWLGGQ